MSHIETVSAIIKDLEAVKEACKRLGVTFVENKSKYEWYGRSVGDYPLPEGMTKEELGTCSHVIQVPGVKYEVGLVARKDGPGYTMAYDFWDDGSRKLGAGLQEKFCKKNANGTYTRGMEKMVSAYAISVLRRQAARKGLRCFETVSATGAVKLTVQQ